MNGVVKRVKEWVGGSTEATEEQKDWTAIKFEKHVKKPWGDEFTIGEYVRWTIKLLRVRKGHRTSLHYHNQKFEVMFYCDGSFEGIPPLVIHRLVGPVEVLEVGMGVDEDVVRVEDDYGRKTK